jgi:mycothiol synthase
VSFLAWPSGSSEPAGLAVLAGRGTPRTLEITVHPEHRPSGASLAATLLDAAVAEARRRGAGAVRLWLRAPDDDADRLSASRGFAPERDLLQLRVPLPLAHGDRGRPATAVRAFRPGRDEAEWLTVNNRAFADHPEQSGWTFDDVVRREGEPWFDPTGFLLHEEGGRLAAFCWTKRHDRPPLGEIYVIGVDPAFQGRGLGRALTVAGLDHLASVGLATGMLYVEATNVAAVELYRSLGFTLHHLDRAYIARLGPQAPDTPTARPMP